MSGLNVDVEIYRNPSTVDRFSRRNEANFLIIMALKNKHDNDVEYFLVVDLMDNNKLKTWMHGGDINRDYRLVDALIVYRSNLASNYSTKQKSFVHTINDDNNWD